MEQLPEVVYLNPDDIMKILPIKITKAYAIIKTLNDELKSNGYMVVRGKVPAKYFRERFYQ